MTANSPSRPTRAEIALEHVRWNFEAVRALVGPDVSVLGVVKADAYGHGAVPVAETLAAAGAAWLGVALPEEGAALRAAGLDLPILCMGGFWDGQEGGVLDADLVPALYRVDQLERLDAEAGRRGTTARYHLKVDTGMGRLGVPAASLASFLDRVARLRRVECDGLMTHLASSDVPDLAWYSRLQVERYGEALAAVEAAGLSPRWRHLANSATSNAFPEARGNLVRPGAVLYGLRRDILSPEGPPMDLKPAMRFVTRVERLERVPSGTRLGYGCTFETARESAIATVPAGYADGVRRGLSNRGGAVVRGVRAPIVGRVSMDLTILDVTDVPGAALGDEAVFFGDGVISAEDVAAEVGTISYEITCGVSARVPRVYVAKNATSL
jgi:alanine racemase